MNLPLNLGSRGPDVARVQSILGENPDGVFGPITQAAVKTWQLARGLAADGVVGPKTWEVMGESLSDNSLNPLNSATGPRGAKGKQSRAWRNRNPGNLRIRSTKQPVDHVAVDTSPGGPFGIYGSERDGWADLAARILQIWRNGDRTIRKIITIWAPEEDNNDTAAYSRGVASALGVSPDAVIPEPKSIATMTVLADAIRRHEGLAADPKWDEGERLAGFVLAGCQ